MATQQEEYTVITSGRKADEQEESNGLSLEERQQLAGLDDETQLLISPENRIDPDAVLVKRGLERSPISRTVFVLGIVGVFVLFGLGIALIAGLGRSRQPDVASTPPPNGSDVIDPSQADLYKGRLALTEQERDQAPRPSAATPTTNPSRSKPNPTPIPRTVSRAPDPPVRSTSSASRSVPAAPVRPVSVQRQNTPPQSAPRPATPVRQQDPMDQWDRLAALGSAKAEVDQQRSASPSDSSADSSAVPTSATSSSFSTSAIPAGGASSAPSSFPSDVIGDGNSFSQSAQPNRGVLVASIAGSGGVTPGNRQPMSPGTEGILHQREAGTAGNSGSNASGNDQVAIGTSAAAEVSVPMYWESGSNSSDDSGRFAVTLKEPLRSTSGDVALPAGTIFITQARVSSDSSRIVNQTVVAVVYQATNGEIKQEPVAPGTIEVRGRNNEPLIATRRQPSNLGNDLMLGLAGGLGRIGELLNQGDVSSSSSSAGGSGGSGSSSTTFTRRSGDTNVLAAAMDGFFNPLVQRMQGRAQAQDRENSSSTNILVVHEGQPVSVFVNGILEVAQ